ncbi:hypothetical protein CQW23_28251 [Capsicum baccatum]|uniref:Uncharacterized protein n=1 Tax=Capsicum baccatum TaxID=33114 RepID=A0A2G2VG07_CAPBA|nr:hypothetical protein CQW23_28251 [Capsicum baccatum]
MSDLYRDSWVAELQRNVTGDDLPGNWSSPVQKPLQGSSEISNDDDHLYKSKSSSYIGESYKYNTLPSLPAQRNLTPPTTLYPQQPMSTPENYSISRFASTQDINTARYKRSDINV